MSKNYTNAMTSLKTVIHDTSFLDAQKISVNPGNGNFNERIDVGSNLRNVSILEHELRGIGDNATFTTNIANSTDNANISGIQVSKKHFISGKINSITIPFSYDGNATNSGYLILQVFASETEILNTFYSDNVGSFADSSATEVRFSFNNVVIPHNYNFIRLALVSSKEISPNIPSGTNCKKFRVKIVKINGNHEFDDDSCKIFIDSTEKNWIPVLNVNYDSYNNGIISSVQRNAEKIERLENKKVVVGTYEKLTAVQTIEKPTNTTEGDAALINSDKLPIGIPIRSIEIPLASAISTPIEILLIKKSSDSVRSFISRSENSTTVNAGENGVWRFSEPFILNENDSLEIYAVKEDFILNGLEVPHPGLYFNWYSTSSGTDSARFGNVWYNNSRDIHIIFNTISESRPINDVIEEIRLESDNHVSKDELKTTIDDVINPHIKDTTIHINEEEHTNLTSLIEVKENIVLSNKENTLTENLTIDGDITSNKSINVLGGNIYIAKGSQISFLDDGEVTISNGASGYPIYNGSPSIVSNGAIYNIGTLTADTDLSNITFDGDETLVQSCEIWFTTGATIYNITWPENVYWIDYDDGAMPSLFANMKYRIVLRREIDDVIASISHFYAVR